MTPHYRGPYRVIQSTGNTVNNQNLITEERHDVLVSYLKPFNYDPTIVNPVEVASHAQQEFLPGKILQIDGNCSTGRHRRYLRTNLPVKVRWTGYSEQRDTWESYQELKHAQKTEKCSVIRGIVNELLLFLHFLVFSHRYCEQTYDIFWITVKVRMPEHKTSVYINSTWLITYQYGVSVALLSGFT